MSLRSPRGFSSGYSMRGITDVEYKVGDTIEYRTLSGQTRRGVVESRDEDIKDGRPGFDTVEGFWGYDADVLRVVVKA